MKYRLTHDDGIAIDVPGVLWEAVLERAYRNGWRPSGTDAPWAGERLAGMGDAPRSRGARWADSDYFSASLQHVRAADAWELGTAAMRAPPLRPDGSARPEGRHDAGILKVASFARNGGFVIGQAPDPSPLRS